MQIRGNPDSIRDSIDKLSALVRQYKTITCTSTSSSHSSIMPPRKLVNSDIDPANVVQGSRRTTKAATNQAQPSSNAPPNQDTSTRASRRARRTEVDPAPAPAAPTSQPVPRSKTPPPQPPTRPQSERSTSDEASDIEDQAPSATRSHHYQGRRTYPNRFLLPDRPKQDCAADFVFWANLSPITYDFIIVRNLQVNKAGKLVSAKFYCSLCNDGGKVVPKDGWSMSQANIRSTTNHRNHFIHHHPEHWESWHPKSANQNVGQKLLDAIENQEVR